MKQIVCARWSQRFQWSWLSQRVNVGEWHLDTCWCLHLPSPACLCLWSWKAVTLEKYFFEFISKAAYCSFLSLRDLKPGLWWRLWTGKQIYNRVHRKRDVWSWRSKASNTEKSRFGGVGKMIRKKNNNPTFNRRVRIGWDAKISLGPLLTWAKGLKKGNDPWKELLNVANMWSSPWVIWRLLCHFPQLIAWAFEPLSLISTHSHSRDYVCPWTHCMQFYTRKYGKAMLPREEKKNELYSV